MERLRYLAVEGPIGVGKSTLAGILAEDLNARLILEEATENPFLLPFYENPHQFAFQTQLFFLLSRYRQQVELKQPNLFQQMTIADYIFAKDKIFASLNLTEDEMDLYSKVYALLDATLPKPDVVVFLQANPEVLLCRIKKRNSEVDQAIKAGYIEKLAEAYNNFFFNYNESPLLVVNCSGSDYVHNKNDYEILKKEVYHLLKSGLDRHYVTIDSR